MNYRPSVKVVDATLRDGGLVNEFRFSDEFVDALYKTNIAAGVDYMEFGYKADKTMFDVNAFGKWKFCNDDDIRAVVGDNDTPLKIAVMADAGRCNYKQDIINRADSPIDLIRVATYIHQMPTAIDMIEDAKKKGYEVSCNIMAVSTAQESDVKTALEMLGKSPVDCVYIVDSYGSLYPEQIRQLCNGTLARLPQKSEVRRVPGIEVHRKIHRASQGGGRSMGLRRSVYDYRPPQSASPHRNRLHEGEAQGLFDLLR